MRTTPTQAKGSYAENVLAILVEHFDLNPTERHVIEEALTRQHTAPSRTFEVIVDSPFSANWRLRPDQADPRLVHLSDYRTPLRTGEDRPVDPRQEAVNAALLALA